MQKANAGSLAAKHRKVDYKLFMLTLPFVIFIFIFYYVMLFGWVYAFSNYVPSKSLFEQEYVGLKHFIRLFEAYSRFPLAFRNTIIIGALSVLGSPVPFVIAVFFSEIPKGKFSRVVQTITSFPNFISWILVFSLFFMFFSTEGRFSQLFVGLGIWQEGYSLLADPDWSYVFQTVLGLWKGSGWLAIIYLSAIAGIDQELYAAALIDGANRWQVMWHITTKSALPTYFVMLVLTISGLANANFDQFYVFTNSLVADRLEVLSTYAYKMGIGNAEIDFGTAIGMVQSIISITLLFGTNKLAKKVTGNSVF